MFCGQNTMLIRVLIWISCIAFLAFIDAHRLQIPTFGAREPRKPPGIRVSPPESVIIRVRRPERLGPKIDVPIHRQSSVMRIQPVLVRIPGHAEASLERVLSEMGLRKMASLIHATQLQPFLQSAGPLTLFAPTDEAFSLTPLPLDSNRMRDIVLQHAIEGYLDPSNLRNDITFPTLSSRRTPLRFNLYDDGLVLSISGSQFLERSRSVGSIRIQPIDKVLYPIYDQDLVSYIRDAFPRMHALINQMSLSPQLTSGTFTLFSPTNEAFDALPPNIRQQLVDNPTLLRKIILNHVVPGSHYTAVLGDGHKLRSLGGEFLNFTTRRGLILVNGVPLIKGDISVTNGVVHGINRLLLPEEFQPIRHQIPATVQPSSKPQDMDTLPDVLDATYIEPPPERPRSLIQTMASPLTLPNGQRLTFSTANALFRRSLLLNKLRGDPSYTVFMPSDAAFGALGPRTLDRLKRNARFRRRVLLCHLVKGRINPSQGGGTIQTLGGPLPLRSLNNGKVLVVGDAKVLSVRSANGGQVMVTDRVSFPPSAPEDPLDKVITSEFKNETNPQARDLYTVFAPTNTALKALSALQLQDKEFLSNLVKSHMVPGAYYRRQLVPGLHLTTPFGNTLIISRGPLGGLRVNDVPLIADEIVSVNGIVYPIDRLLFIPVPKPIMPPLDDLNQIGSKYGAVLFLKLMKQSGLDEALAYQVSRTGGCTIFLPTDEALKKMTPTLKVAIFGDPDRLKRFIMYHISPMVLRPDFTKNNDIMPSLLPNKNIRCNQYDGQDDTPVMTASGCVVSDVVPSSDNVTVAILKEGTMTPPIGDLQLTASKSPLLRNFSKILKVADIKELLQDEGPFTLFAPSACVFAAMDPEEYRQLITNKKKAREFVKRHLVRGCYYTNGLQDGQILITEAGTELHVKVTPECIEINGVKLTYGDMSATDGVLHMLASVLPS